jgi:putative membrane-bound dehydrogenase-like protein
MAAALVVAIGFLWSERPDAAEPALVPENLAKGKPATASSFQREDLAPGLGNDGNLESRWCADGPKLGSWWQVDLGKAEDLTGCRVVWEFDGRNYRFKIEGSPDGKTWSMLTDQTSGTSKTQIQTHKFTASGVRYVRITITGLPPGAWPSFYEFQVLGKRLVKPDVVAEAVRADPKGLLAGVKVSEGFEVSVFAAPPDISYPTCLAAAPDGTLFVGVDLNGSLGARPARGKIVRCIDSKGAGRADRFNVFANVDSPRGLWFDNNTLYVLHPPLLEAFYDDDGDGVADRHEVLVSGLGFDLKMRGADHTTNGFRMGIDGWLYIAVGDYGAMKAKGKDGATLHLHGGGVVRVRPDGTGLELVCDGLRNIYDVAVSPTLDLFTRDNTNDGGGWDVRLSHIIPTGHYGYPTLFQHFGDEIIQPLADYGGGAPCGALFLDEPRFPKEYGSTLYTCDWGRSEVYRHPLEPNGSTWKVKQVSFVRISRPTDIDVDGSGRLYISSWKDGGFDFSRPNVGYVVRVVPKGHKASPFPDLKKASEADLLKYLAADSGVLRLHTQREILRRGAKGNVAEALEKLAEDHASPAVQVAAVFTLKQVAGKGAQPALLRLARQANLREYALRALADDRAALAEVPADAFVAHLKDENARVRVQAVVGLSRLGKGEVAGLLLERTADTDLMTAHVAVNALVSLRAGEVCLSALQPAGDPKLVPGALRVLQSLHEPQVVEGLIRRYRTATEEKLRRELFRVLARLYHREADWDGKWWGTRPDTTGPYFKPVTWSESSKIGAVLSEAFRKADAPTLRWMIPEFLRLRVDLPELAPTLLKLADDPAFRRTAVEFFVARSAPPAEAVPLLRSTAVSEKEEATLRAVALRGLLKLPGNAAAGDAVVEALTVSGKLPSELDPLWGEFVRDGRQVGRVDYFVKLAKEESPRRRELAYSVLATIAGRNLGSVEARAAAGQAVEQAWSKPESAAPLLRAVTRLNLTVYGPQIRKLLADADPQVAGAAKVAAATLKLDHLPSGPLVGKLKYEEAVAKTVKEKGDAAAGEQIFNRLGCINCHTTTPTDTLKGPFLGGIATRYSRTELLESILKPSAKIAQGFETHIFSLEDGRQITGFIVRESGTEVEVRDGTGATRVLKKKAIEERIKSPLSVMPEGLADALTVPELGSLLAYLETLKGK